VHSGVSVALNVNTIFHAWVGPVRILEKARRDTLRRTSVLHRVGSAGHVVHSVASGRLNVNALFFMLGRDEYGFDKKRDRTSHAKHVFLHPVGYAGHIVHCGASGA
jgi:hypothetical protein